MLLTHASISEPEPQEEQQQGEQEHEAEAPKPATNLKEPEPEPQPEPELEPEMPEEKEEEQQHQPGTVAHSEPMSITPAHMAMGGQMMAAAAAPRPMWVTVPMCAFAQRPVPAPAMTSAIGPFPHGMPFFMPNPAGGMPMAMMPFPCMTHPSAALGSGHVMGVAAAMAGMGGGSQGAPDADSDGELPTHAPCA